MSRLAATPGGGAGKPAGAAEASAAAAGTRPGLAEATVPVTGGTGFLAPAPYAAASWYLQNIADSELSGMRVTEIARRIRDTGAVVRHCLA